MPDNERLDKIEQSVSKMSEDITEIKVNIAKLQTNSCEKNSKTGLDLKTILILAGLIVGGGTANYGITQAASTPETIIKYIPMPQTGYSLEQPNPYSTP